MLTALVTRYRKHVRARAARRIARLFVELQSVRANDPRQARRRAGRITFDAR